jgi:hypothetical protein
MHDEVSVRVVHRRAHLAKQVQAVADREPAVGTVPIDGRAFDELHHQVRDAVVGLTSVEEARDVRVVERGQDPALAAKTLRMVGARDRAGQFDGDAPVEVPVGAARQQHQPHATAAHDALDFVGPDAAPYPARLVGVARLAYRAVHRAAQGRGGVYVRVQERLHFAPQLVIAGARLIEVGGAVVPRKGDGGGEDVANLLPASGVHGVAHAESSR